MTRAMTPEQLAGALREAHSALYGAVADSPAPVFFRLRMIVTAFYDEAADEPDQAMRDLLTDVMHECDRRGIDFYEAVAAAAWMSRTEREEWGIFPRDT